MALAQIKREQILELEKQRREEAWERSQKNAERALEQKMVRNELKSAAAGTYRRSTGMYRSNSTPNVSFSSRRNNQQKPTGTSGTGAATKTQRPGSYCSSQTNVNSSRLTNRRSTFDNSATRGGYYKGASTGNIGPKGFQGIPTSRTSLRSPNPSAYAKSPRPLSSQNVSSAQKPGQAESSGPGNHVPFMKKPLIDPTHLKRRSVMDIKTNRPDPPRSPIALTSNVKLEHRPVAPKTTPLPRRPSSSRKSESEQLNHGSRDSSNDPKSQSTEMSEEEAYKIKLMMKRKEAKEREQAEKERRLKEEAEEEERRLIRLEEEKKLAEERRIEAERLAEEERKLEAERKIEEEKRQEEERKRLEEERKLEEQRKIEREKELEEEKKREAERKLKEEIEAKERKLIEQLQGANALTQGATTDKSSGDNGISSAAEPATFDEAQRLIQQKEEEERAARKAHMANIMARVRAANSGKSTPRGSDSALIVEAQDNNTHKNTSQPETDDQKNENSESSPIETDVKDSKSDAHENNDDVFESEAPKEHDVSKDAVAATERVLSESEDEHV